MAMIEEISGKLQTELGITDASDIAVLTAKVENAYREVKRARNYQPHHTDEFVSADMETFGATFATLHCMTTIRSEPKGRPRTTKIPFQEHGKTEVSALPA